MPTSRVKLRKPRIQTKFIHDEKVVGLAYQNEFRIEIDPRQSSKEYLNTLIHEELHCFLPDLSEKAITRMADLIAESIWSRRFRRMEKKPKSNKKALNNAPKK